MDVGRQGWNQIRTMSDNDAANLVFGYAAM